MTSDGNIPRPKAVYAQMYRARSDDDVDHVYDDDDDDDVDHVDFLEEGSLAYAYTNYHGRGRVWAVPVGGMLADAVVAAWEAPLESEPPVDESVRMTASADLKRVGGVKLTLKSVTSIAGPAVSKVEDIVCRGDVEAFEHQHCDLLNVEPHMVLYTLCDIVDLMLSQSHNIRFFTRLGLPTFLPEEFGPGKACKTKLGDVEVDLLFS